MRAVGSSHNPLLADEATRRRLGFADIRLYDVPSTVESLIVADDTDSRYITWKATTAKADSNVLYDYELAHRLERKSVIRQLLPRQLFPAFRSMTVREAKKTAYDDLISGLEADSLVVQEDFSTGGKGTFFVSDSQQYEAALASMDNGSIVVISRMIEGESMAVQCFAGNDKVYSMPWWHKDLVAIPGVCKDVSGATKYCGAQLYNIPQQYRAKLHELVETVGSHLMKAGYAGVFGMDIVVYGDIMYLIEINPRFTAVSHLYGSVMCSLGYKTDFMTAAACQATGLPVDYEDFEQEYPLEGPVSYLKLQNIQDNAVLLAANLQLGVYREGVLHSNEHEVAGLQQPGDILVVPEADLQIAHEPGARIFSVIMRGEAIQAGELSEWAERSVSQLRSQFVV